MTYDDVTAATFPKLKLFRTTHTVVWPMAEFTKSREI